MFYLDTSFVVSVFLPDIHTARALTWLKPRMADELAVSAWGMVEFAGVFARQVRMARMSRRAADSAIDDLRDWSSRNCEIIVPQSADFALAAEFVRRYDANIRAPDAIHLAISSNWGGMTLVTFDVGMMAAAPGIGIKLAGL